MEQVSEVNANNAGYNSPILRNDDEHQKSKNAVSGKFMQEYEKGITVTELRDALLKKVNDLWSK